MMKLLNTLWARIVPVIYTIALFAVFVLVENPNPPDTIGWVVYATTRILLAAIIWYVSSVLYDSSPRSIRKRMQLEFHNNEITRLDELPEYFESLSVRALIMLDLIWAREHLLQSGLMYSRFIPAALEVSALRQSYEEFTNTYSRALLAAFEAYNPPKAKKFIRYYKQYINLFFDDIEKLGMSKPFLMSRRREAIIQAFFKFYDNIRTEIELMDEPAYAI